jgi:hypothetical protein
MEHAAPSPLCSTLIALLLASVSAGPKAASTDLYLPAAQHTFTELAHSVFYTDAAHLQREVKLLIRHAIGSERRSSSLTTAIPVARRSACPASIDCHFSGR